MNCTDRDNYFSIYMKRRKNLNKSKKNIFGKSNKTLKNTKISNLNLHNEKSSNKIMFDNSGKKDKSSISYIRNNFFHKDKEIITVNKIDNFFDEDEKIDYLQQKIYNILDIIDNFKAEYFQKNEKKMSEKNEIENIQIRNKEININKQNQIKQNHKLMSFKDTKKKSLINNKENIINIYNKNENPSINNFVKKNKHQKSNSQFCPEKKAKEILIKKRFEYSNSINKKFIKNKNKNLSQSQVFLNKKIINQNNSPRIKKINDNFEIGSDNSSTREMSEKLFNEANIINKNKKLLINNLSRQNKIKGIKIKDFKQLTKGCQDYNDKYKCISDRAQRKKNISKKYEFDID